MKLFLFFFGVAILLGACNDQQKSGSDAAIQGTASKDKTGSSDALSGAAQEKTEALQTLVPYTLDQLKAMLPASLQGAMLQSSSANAALGAPFASGEYALNDSTGFRLEFFDCAGQAGAGIYNRQFLAAMDFQPGNADEYSKVVDFNGAKAIEHMDNANQLAAFTFLAADRFLVTLEGKNMDMEFLKKAGEELKLK